MFDWEMSKQQGTVKRRMTAGKMRANEVYVDASLVGRLLAAQFPQWADLSIKPVHSAGTDNAIYRLGEHMAV